MRHAGTTCVLTLLHCLCGCYFGDSGPLDLDKALRGVYVVTTTAPAQRLLTIDDDVWTWAESSDAGATWCRHSRA